MFLRGHIPVAEVAWKCRPRQSMLLNRAVFKFQVYRLQVIVEGQVFVCKVSLVDELCQVNSDSTFVLAVVARISGLQLLRSLLHVLVFPFRGEEYSFDSLFFIRGCQVHLGLLVLEWDAATVHKNAVKLTSLLIDSLVDRSNHFVATLTVSCSLDQCFFLVVENAAN